MNPPINKQFLKFCIVGTSGTLIDFTILNLLVINNMTLTMAGTISFSAAVLNNYLWNRSWTFQNSPPKNRGVQMMQFLLISLIGLAIRLPILQLGTLIPTEPLQTLGLSHKTALLATHNLSLTIAIGCVLLWNFFGNKFWTFKATPKHQN